MSRQTLSVLTILACGLVTYALRLGGLLLADRLPKRGRVRAFMDALPGTLLLSLIAPSVVENGIWGGVATLFTALCAIKTKSPLLSMLVGMAIIAVQRYVTQSL